jgi:hypothetical protein
MLHRNTVTTYGSALREADGLAVSTTSFRDYRWTEFVD